MDTTGYGESGIIQQPQSSSRIPRNGPDQTKANGLSNGQIRLVDQAAKLDYDADSLNKIYISDGLSGYHKYTDIEHIGEGSYGTVFRATDHTGLPVAMKWIPVKDSVRNGLSSTTLREIALLKKLKHPNIAKFNLFIRRFMDTNRLYRVYHKAPGPPIETSDAHVVEYVILILELMDWDLRTVSVNTRALQHKNPVYHSSAPVLDRSKIQSYMFQLLSGIAFLHSNNIVHRDIKPSNVLVHRDGRVVLCDFGLARSYGLPISHAHNYYTSGKSKLKYSKIGGYSPEVCTVWYRAPDMIVGNNHYQGEVDIWSAGCLFGELCFGEPLFATTEDKVLPKIIDLCGYPPNSYWNWLEKHFTTPCYTKNEVLETYEKYEPKRGDPYKLNWDYDPINSFHQLKKNLMERYRFSHDPEMIDLLARMLDLNPNIRITAREALNHSYFQGVLLPPKKLDRL